MSTSSHTPKQQTNQKAGGLIPINPTSYLFYDILYLAIVLRYINWYTKHHLLEREKNNQSYAGVWNHL